MPKEGVFSRWQLKEEGQKGEKGNPQSELN